MVRSNVRGRSHVASLGCRVLESRVKGQGSRVQGKGSRVQGQGYRVKGQRSRAKGPGSRSGVKGGSRIATSHLA